MRPAIFGLRGHALQENERQFFKDCDPMGFILFARNIDSPDQVKTLVADLKDTVGRDCVVAIDQEGGRVARLKEPHWPKTHAVAELTADSATAGKLVALHTSLIAVELQALGINCCCAPVLDIPVDEADPIIGDRAYAKDGAMVAHYGRLAADALMEAGILPVIKHIPGHGRANVDSHLDMPVVSDSREMLADDFYPFQALADIPFAMTAHIAYDALDPGVPATFSRRVVTDIIRGEIGFSGLLMTDDLSMQALDGSLEIRALKALAAGCDILLHCNGDMAEMEAVAGVCPLASDQLTTSLLEVKQGMLHPLALNLDDLRQSYKEETKKLSNTRTTGDNA